MTQKTSASKVTVRREIGASAKDVFDAWLDPASLAIWMRPGGVPRSTAKVDPRVGGAFEIVMHAVEGPIRHAGIYRVIDRPKRLVFTWISPATHFTDSLVTVEFLAGRSPKTTEVVVTHELLPDTDAVASHTEGWTQALELLAVSLSGAPTS
jgi:uncharacterized protein YndB with AHSA1/START domain